MENHVWSRAQERLSYPNAFLVLQLKGRNGVLAVRTGLLHALLQRTSPPRLGSQLPPEFLTSAQAPGNWVAGNWVAGHWVAGHWVAGHWVAGHWVAGNWVAGNGVAGNCGGDTKPPGK